MKGDFPVHEYLCGHHWAGVNPPPSCVVADCSGYEQSRPGAMTHAELQELIVTRCRDLGHWYYAPQESFRSQPGWVDLVIISRNGGHLFVELKSDAGRRTRPQMQVAELLQRAGLEYRLWRPEDWLGAKIERELVEL